MARYDVLILGGGIIGCALAEELARRGRRVMVLERGRIGAEASVAAAGILASQPDLQKPDALFELCQASRRLYPAWIGRLQRRSGVAVAFHVDGILYLVFTKEEAAVMERRAAWQRQRGCRIERWSAAEVRRREPPVDGRIRGGFYFPTEAQVDTVKLMEALAAACRRSGVEVRESTVVRRVRLREGAVRGVETDRAFINAPVVVNCLGSWANLGGTFPVRLPVEPVRGQIVVFAARPGLFRHALMSDRGYLVQRRDGQLIVGSTVERVGFEKALTVQGMHQILTGALSMSRALASCIFVDAWAGLRPYAPMPLLGPTRIEGLYVAAGHFRHGILLAPITAQVMADLILHGRPAIEMAAFSLP